MMSSILTNSTTSILDSTQYVDRGTNAQSQKIEISGKLKTDQVMLECFFKVTEIIVQSRIQLHADDPIVPKKRTRRARFNLDIDEIEHLRHSMAQWKNNLHLPLTIDIFCKPPPSSNQKIKKDKTIGYDENRIILLERWIVEYIPRADFDDHLNVISQLRQVVKRIGILLRTMYSYVRLLPAFQVSKQCQEAQASDLVGYAVYDMNEKKVAAGTSEASKLVASNELNFPLDVSVSRYQFEPIETPYGLLKISILYRPEFSFSIENCSQSLSIANCIIQNYVPNSPSKTLSLPRDIPSPLLTKTNSFHHSYADKHLYGKEITGSLPVNIPGRAMHIRISPNERDNSDACTNLVNRDERTEKLAYSLGDEKKYLPHDSPINRISSRISSPYGYSNLRKDFSFNEKNWGVQSDRTNIPRHPNISTSLTQESSHPLIHRPSIESAHPIDGNNNNNIVDMHRMRQQQSAFGSPLLSSSDKNEKILSRQMTPPFCFSYNKSPSNFSLSIPELGSSPPFQGNPCQLISSSPSPTSPNFLKHIEKGLPSPNQKNTDMSLSVSLDRSPWGFGSSKPLSGSSIFHLSSFKLDEESQMDSLPFASSNDSSSKSTLSSLGQFVQQLKTLDTLEAFNVHEKDIEGDEQEWENYLENLTKFHKYINENI